MDRPEQGDRANLVALAPARHAVYSFLSGAFAAPPTAELLSALSDPAFLASVGELFGGAVRESLGRCAASGLEPSDGRPELRQEFMNLFRVPTGRYVTPYESVFRDTREIAGRKVKGLLMGQSAVDVQKWYRLAALKVSDEYRDLPDHICLELGYLARLCAKEQDFVSAGDERRLTRTWEMQRDFLAAHVVSWIDALRDKIHQMSQHPFYRAVADMAAEFARRDLATLEDSLGKSANAPVPDYAPVEA